MGVLTQQTLDMGIFFYSVHVRSFRLTMIMSLLVHLPVFIVTLIHFQEKCRQKRVAFYRFYCKSTEHLPFLFLVGWN